MSVFVTYRYQCTGGLAPQAPNLPSQNPAVPPHPNNSNLDSAARDLASAIGYLVCTLVLIFAIIFFIAWVFFSTKDPEFQVDSFSLSNFTLVRNDSAISVAAQVQLTARNPNKFAALSFWGADANVNYRSSWSLGPTVLPPFSLGPGRQAPLTASFAAVVETGVSDGKVAGFDLKLLSSVRYKDRALGNRRNRALTVFCDGLVVGIPSDHGRPGGLIGRAPRPCRVDISSSRST